MDNVPDLPEAGKNFCRFVLGSSFGGLATWLPLIRHCTYNQQRSTITSRTVYSVLVRTPRIGLRITNYFSLTFRIRLLLV